MAASDTVLTERLLRFRPGLFAGSLATGLLVLLFVGAWGYQIRNDIGVAGINRPVFWGFYITNFVFWIGISHAGTLISAILRVTGAEWRRPVTRCAEAITVFALAIGGLFPIIHLGRPDKLLYMLPLPNSRGLWPNFRSPLIWDLAAITAYVVGSILYLYLPMIPDMALLRDRAKGRKRLLYSILAIGWRGTARQWRSLESGIKVMAVVIIPVAVSVHTIVSWDFAMTQTPMWNSTIFGPYFVVGAIYSGIGVLMIAMALLRRGLDLGAWLSDRVFNNLGLLFLAMTLFWGYFTFAEHVTVWYANEVTEARVFWDRVTGSFSTPFWIMVVLNFVVPMLVLPFRWGRKPLPTAVIGFGVLIGMWLERYLIVVPSLTLPRLAYTIGSYSPSWVEIAIAVGALGTFVFLYLAFTQLAPIISIWEVREGRHLAGEEGDALEPLETATDATPPADGATLLQATFINEEKLEGALERLSEIGIEAAMIEARSSIPLTGAAAGDVKSKVPYIAMAGGAAGGLGVYLLATLTSKAYPIFTGHMSLTPAPPIGIVTYEGIALGLVLATFLGVLLEARLPRRSQRGPLDGRLADGCLLVSVRCPDGQALERAQSALDGALDIAVAPA